MKIQRALVFLALIAMGVAALAQESSLLGGCLGKTRAAYAKAFEDKFTEVKKTKNGKITVGLYKTGSAAIEVIQTAKAKTPDLVNVFFYQQPKRTWQDALKTIGVSAKGVKAKPGAKGVVKLTGIKVKKLKHVTGVFVAVDKENNDSPTLHLTLK